MDLRLRSSLACSTNLRGRVRGDINAYMLPRENQVVTSSHPNSETLTVCEVLAHPRVVFHPCPYGLRRGAAAVAIVLINYNDGGCCRNDHEDKTIVIDYFLYTDARLHRIAAPTLLPLHCASSGNNAWSPTRKFSWVTR
jgi:hypothetical protein